LSLDAAFRHSPVWAFWMLERLIKNDLYFREKGRRERRGSGAQPETAAEVPLQPDAYARLFGRVDPRHIPESTAWWHSRQAELLAISDEHELGMMTGMVTTTQNDNSPELLAHARRGPCARPTDAEMCEYLLVRRPPGYRRPKIQQDAAAATISYQTRTRVLKHHFLKRHRMTPLGIPTDYWDRTEEQTRKALHGHIPWWSKRRYPLACGRAHTRGMRAPFPAGGASNGRSSAHVGSQGTRNMWVGPRFFFDYSGWVGGGGRGTPIVLCERKGEGLEHTHYAKYRSGEGP
jgi:hypothetical protein